MANPPRTSAGWIAPPEYPELNSSQLDIWRLSLDRLPCRPENLNTEESRRLERYKFQQGRQNFCAARTAVREILATYLNCFPVQVPIEVARGGKPGLSLPEKRLYFNLSHCADTALLAIHGGSEIGIDIELERDIPHRKRIAQRTLQPEALTRLEQSGWDTNTFFTLWTGMEARQKCLGRGVFGDVVDSTTVETLNFAPGQGYHAAVAWTRGHKPEAINFYAKSSQKTGGEI